MVASIVSYHSVSMGSQAFLFVCLFGVSVFLFINQYENAILTVYPSVFMIFTLLIFVSEAISVMLWQMIKRN